MSPERHATARSLCTSPEAAALAKPCATCAGCAFVFDNIAHAPGMTGDLPEAHALARKVSQAWVAFARNGTPDHAELTPWPAYTETERATMILDNECRVVNDPDREQRLAWEGVRLRSM